MAQDFQKRNHSETPSTVQKFQRLQSKQKTKLSTLPPLRQGGGHNKSKMKTSTRVQPVHPKSTVTVTSQLMTPRERLRREHVPPGRMHAKIRLMRSMLRNQRTALQELNNHESFLTKLNQELIRDIQDMEDSTALNVRAMLQQQDVLGNVIDVLEYLNRKNVHQLKSELQEWEEKEECKMNRLEQELEQLNAEIRTTHEEVSFLSTYMDHEYPIRSVQIANHMRQLQQAKDNQQDELDNLKEMRRVVLQSLSNAIQEKKKEILRSLIVKTQKPHEEFLVQKTQGSQLMRKCTVWFRGVIEHLKKELPVLMAAVEEPQAEIRETREVVFEDILLRRPKCTPETAVILCIPMEELLPF